MSEGPDPVGGPTAWEQTHLGFVLRPDWELAPKPQRPVVGLAFLWMWGLSGAYILFILLHLIAVPAGFNSTIGDALDEVSALNQLLLVVVIAPLIEETTYRLPLMRRVSLPLVALSGVLTSLFFIASQPFIVVVGLSVACGALAAWAIPSVRARVEDRWERFPAWPIWGFSVLFALTHLVNFDIEWSVVAVLAIPIAVGPQLWLGLMFSIGRVRYGWWAGLAVHAAHNLTVWSIAQVVT